MPRGNQTLELIQRQDECLRLHLEGQPWAAVAAAVGYRSAGAAHDAAKRAAVRVNADRIAERQQIEESRLEVLIGEAWKIYHRHHYVVAGKDGVIALGPPGPHGEPPAPLDDDGPKLEALRLIKQLSESLRKLVGADAPSRRSVEVVNIDVIDAEILRLEAEELAKNDPVDDHQEA